MDPGELRSRIKIEKLSRTTNTIGNSVKAWSTHATVWAKAEHLSGRELTMAQQIAAEITDEFTIRYRADIANTHIVNITESYRIRYAGRVYNIRDVKDFENRHVWLYLKCEAVQGEQ